MKVFNQCCHDYKINIKENSYTLSLFKTIKEITFIIKNESFIVAFKSTYTRGRFIDIDERFVGFTIDGIFQDILSAIEERTLTFSQKEKSIITFSYKLGRELINIPIHSIEKNENASLSSQEKKDKENYLAEENVKKEAKKETIPREDKIIQFLKVIISEKFLKLNNALGEITNQISKIYSLLGENKRSQKSTSYNSQKFGKDYIKSIKIAFVKKDHNGYVNSLCLTKDKRLASCSSDKTIKIFDLTSFECDLTLTGHKGGINHVSSLENGNLVSSSADMTIKLWEISKESFKCLNTFKGHTEAVWKSIQLSKGVICSCSGDSTLKIWKASGLYQCIQTLKGHDNCVISVLELKNKKFIVSGSNADNTVRFWDTFSYLCVKTFENCGCYWNNSLIEAFGKVIVGGYNGVINIINIDTLQKETLIELKNIRWISSLLDLGNHNILCASKEKIINFDLVENRAIETREEVHQWSITGMVILEDGSLITSSTDSLIKIWKK